MARGATPQPLASNGTMIHVIKGTSRVLAGTTVSGKQQTIHGTLTFKGTMSSGGNPAFTSTINVLFVVTSSNMVDIQSNFNGVLMAPNAYIHAVPGKHHYGAFYGSTVYLEQDTEFEHRPFNAPLPLQ